VIGPCPGHHYKSMVDTYPVNRKIILTGAMSISKNDIKKQKASKNEKMAELESKAASGSGAAKKKLAKMQKK
jgi:hypothetical protein